MKDLEARLPAQQSDSKKALEGAQNVAALREKECAERLSSLARVAGG